MITTNRRHWKLNFKSMGQMKSVKNYYPIIKPPKLVTVMDLTALTRVNEQKDKKRGGERLASQACKLAHQRY